jgi:hypothetical protein
MVIAGIGLLFLSLSFSGCEEILMKPDYIAVNIMVAVYVRMVDANNNVLQKNPDGTKVSIEITKAKGDRLVFERIVQNGLCQATGNFNINEGQFIECIVTFEGDYQGYTPVSTGYALLTWDMANASENLRGVYNWYPEITINLKKS